MTEERTVQEVIDIARQWADDHYSGRPDFVGAHLVGSLHHMPLDAPFASYRDVDLAIILDSITEQDIDDANYEKLIIEAILAPAHRYESAEKLCADACNASILAADRSILLDPQGKLAPLAERVKAEYSERKWVVARRDEVLGLAAERLEQLKNATEPQQATFALGELQMYLIAVLTTVHLTPLTHRRNMVQLKALISSEEEGDIFEKLHQLMGSDQLTQEDVQSLLEETIEAFDYANSVHKTPVAYDHKLDPCVRPYLVEGTREMFAEGGYRESFFWICLFLLISCAAIQADGDDAAQARFLPLAGKMLSIMKVDSQQAIQDKAAFAKQVFEDVSQLSDKIIETDLQPILA